MEYDLVNRPHPHPLLFVEEFNESDDQVVMCSRCRLDLPMDPSAYTCSDSDCNFRIHESCLHLPSHITYTPQDHLLIEQYSFRSCSACGRCPSSYMCSKCSFKLDIRCAILDRDNTKVSGFWEKEKYVHFSHVHPLTFSPSLQKRSVCVMCERVIESGSSYYFCSHSKCEGEDTQFHKQCAEQPRVLENPDYHSHPLLLQVLDYDVLFNICISCRYICKGWAYACLHCKFLLHLPCLRSFNHIHNFTKMFSRKMDFTCDVCGGQSYYDFPWCCDQCPMLVHKKCTEFPSTLISPEHHHLLTFNYFFPSDKDVILCQICGGKMETKYAGYACSTCDNFTAHLECAEKETTLDSPPFNSAANSDLVLPEFDEDHYCAAKLLLPTTIKPLYRLHPHPLTLISIHPDIIVSQCDACFQYFNGPAYQCQTCLSTFDVRCASVKHPLTHPNHPHPLFLYDPEVRYNDNHCEACGEKIEAGKLVFRCSLCEFYLDIVCATLPVEVSYRFDAHPLNLTYGEAGERSSDYYCDICEEEREVGVWFYSCPECEYAAHPRCALGEFPNVKSGMHKSHRHPLTLQTLNKLGNEQSSPGGSNLAFQCGVCNFTLHANEEPNLDFGCQNVFSRAIQLYPDYHHHPRQKRHIGESVILGPFGCKSPSRIWKEWVFSTISAFAVFIDGKRLFDIQIQYAKNGELKWSEAHNSAGENNKTLVSPNFTKSPLKLFKL